MGFRLAKTEVHTLHNPEDVRALARKLQSYGGTECEREEKAFRKGKIKEKMLGKELIPFDWRVGHVQEVDRAWRVDGMHGSEVSLELTPEEWARVEFPVTVVWQDYNCDSLTDLPVLFEQFNASWSSRNKQDLIGAHMGIHKDLHECGLSRYLAEKITAGLLWHERNVEGHKVGEEYQFTVIHEKDGKHTFLTWCSSFLQKGKTNELFAPAVMAALYHTTRSRDEDTRSFWRRVASGKVTLDADTVEYKLADFLDLCADKGAEWPRSVARHFPRGNVNPSPRDVFATCLRAFASSRTGRKIGEIFTPTKGKKVSEIVAELLPSPTT